ncbi:MAG: sugar ABC transporter permease [Thermoflexales bacterium]
MSGMRAMRVREALTGYLFILPTLVGFLVFALGPMLFSAYLSLHEWEIFSPPKFVGLDNFKFLPEDTRFTAGFVNTLKFVIAVVALNTTLALGAAVGLQTKMPVVLRNFFRTSYFLPVVMSMTSVAIILSFLFHKEFGIVNYYLGLVGIEKVPWLASSSYALSSVVLATVWKTFGFDMILFSAALNNVPRHFYEAAEIDGASAWQRFWRITVPQISPSLFFATVIGIISHFQVFDAAYLMTRGGPGDATRTLVMTIYEDAFGSLRLGYGSAMAMILFVIVMVLTILQFKWGQKLVHYQ